MAEPTEKEVDIVSDLITYESGDMSSSEVVRMFQYLIDQDMIHKLQGHYGRMAKVLIDAGYCHPRVLGNK